MMDNSSATSRAAGGAGVHASAASVDAEDVARFSAIAEEWWNPEGPFRPLHRLNPARLAYLRDVIGAHFERDPADVRPFKDLDVLDIGCGGGLVSEPMARLGARVTGVDASDRNIAIASAHAAGQDLQITYRAASAEALAEEGATFDVILALEIIEHTADPASFLASCRRMLRPGGIMVLSTLNRTKKSFLLGIVAAEYVLRWVPRGTHEWRKFLRPSELARHLRAAGFELCGLKGVTYNPVDGGWSLSDRDLDVNYFAVALPVAARSAH
ncbi:MAG TPA: bifunctional 2-polyprenyl-6-hydroxyphenol methylase/3-demethylubiquinol 3-O-methyltransferase UbiG [Sphingomonadales bacterium]